MSSLGRATLIGAFLLAATFAASAPAAAQVDFTGVWNSNTNAEDGPERAAGPSLVEFLGLPINDQARQWGLAYRPGRLSLTEHQCQVHVVHYIHRGPFGARSGKNAIRSRISSIAIHEAINTYEQHRVIWMDGRPHPSPNAPHTWMGFSTGVWQGNMLTITTTHIKQGWYRRENIPSSDEATTIEHWVRNGNVWTHISVTEDPNYLAEPLIKSEDFTLNPNPNNFNPFWPCEYIEEGERARGEVPHYLPGENPWVAEYAATHNLPQEVTLGGPEQMYPEYRSRLKTLPVAVFKDPDADPPAAAPAEARGAWRRACGQDGGSRASLPAAVAGGADEDNEASHETIACTRQRSSSRWRHRPCSARSSRSGRPSRCRSRRTRTGQSSKSRRCRFRGRCTSSPARAATSRRRSATTACCSSTPATSR